MGAECCGGDGFKQEVEEDISSNKQQTNNLNRKPIDGGSAGRGGLAGRRDRGGRRDFELEAAGVEAAGGCLDGGNNHHGGGGNCLDGGNDHHDSGGCLDVDFDCAD